MRSGITLLITLLLTLFGLSAQTAYTGCITDDKGDPLIGASIMIEGTTTGTVTDFDGCFRLTSDLDTAVMVVSYVGYISREMSVGRSKADGLHLSLSESSGILEEVAVTGMAGSRRDKASKKRRPASSVSVVDAFADSRSALPVTSPAIISPTSRGITFSDGAAVPGLSLPVSDTDHEEEAPEAGRLTAGELNDFSKWALWEDVREEDLAAHRAVWGYAPSQRYVAQLTYTNGAPVVDAPVTLTDNDGKVVFQARTDNQGRAELWADLFGDEKQGDRAMSLTSTLDGQTLTYNSAIVFEQGINGLEVRQNCMQITTVDVAFVVDATGSMDDEMRYLASEMQDVIKRSMDTLEGQDVRFTSVYYRDEGEEYLTRHRPFGESIEAVTAFAGEQKAKGGGDHPEAVDAGLDVALNQLRWSATAAARLLFLVLDAPPHQDAKTVKKMQELGRLAAEKGVKIIPVVCSGMGKDGEYLLRSLALTTNGTYVFLTDDSGIGGEHLEPTTDSYEVEMLNDLLVRLIFQFGRTNNCNEVLAGVEKPQDSPAEWSVFPNPTMGPATVRLPRADGLLFLLDANGKLLQRIQVSSRQEALQLGQLPSGSYLIRWESGEAVSTRKIVVSRA